METRFTDDEGLIGRFLQGQLEEGARDEFLARYLEDPIRLQRLRTFLREREIPERFLRDELSEPERDAFEMLGLADPGLFDELQLIERTKEGLKALDREGKLDRERRSDAWPRFLRSPHYAAAASVLLAVSVVVSGVLWRDNASLRVDSATALASSFASARFVRVLGTRGTPTVIEAPGPEDVTVLYVDPGTLDFDSYRATIRRMDGDLPQTVWQADGLELTFQQVGLIVPGRVLAPGAYEISVEGRVQDGQDTAAYAPTNMVPLEIAASRD